MTLKYLQNFKAAIESDWRAKLADNEWFFNEIYTETVRPLSRVEAFEAIGEACQLLLTQSDSFLIYQCAELLVGLARRSDTTELPPLLLEVWPKIVVLLEGAGCSSTLKDLCRWYRKPKVLDLG